MLVYVRPYIPCTLVNWLSGWLAYSCTTCHPETQENPGEVLCEQELETRTRRLYVCHKSERGARETEQNMWIRRPDEVKRKNTLELNRQEGNKPTDVKHINNQLCVTRSGSQPITPRRIMSEVGCHTLLAVGFRPRDCGTGPQHQRACGQQES